MAVLVGKVAFFLIQENRSLRLSKGTCFQRCTDMFAKKHRHFESPLDATLQV
jgi:hypothetical protein